MAGGGKGVDVTCKAACFPEAYAATWRAPLGWPRGLQPVRLLQATHIKSRRGTIPVRKPTRPLYNCTAPSSLP